MLPSWGVVLADVGLFTPDFRSAERTFSLLTQVAGRAGRGRLPGEVIIQTYVPQAEAVQCAVAQDVMRFAESELRRRRWLGFPPCARLASLTISSRELERALECASLLTGFLRRLRHRDACRGCTILGPMPAPIGRMRGRWRQRILIRAESPAALHALLRLALAEYAQHPKPSAVSITIDIDPLDML